jgi:hypothetical protein
MNVDYKRIFGNTIKMFILVCLFLAMTSSTNGLATEGLFREDFDTLDEWKPLTFPKIKEHSTYSIETDQGNSYLKAESSNSASGLVYKTEFTVFDYPKARWRWKVDNVYRQGNAMKKAGDDYPIRVYIVFHYDPENASFGKKIKYGLARKLYGEYPPHSSLNYIWANRKQKDRFLTNTYADEAKMVILQTGADKSGTWQEEEVDILDDYRKAFGVEPPAVASIAIMNDSDNTGESSVSYIDYIEVFRE